MTVIHNFANARWARGNSWLTIVIPDFLELLDLPENNAVRRYLVQVLNAQIAALAKCQDESGLWHTLLDDPHSYLEASATAGFAYGILKAVRKRYVEAALCAGGGKSYSWDSETYLAGRRTAANVIWHWHGPRSRFLPSYSVDLYALRAGDGHAVFDGIPA
ncbi:Rhamnogalacturonides degradation protein RhiN [Salmonella enterica subsp. salamae]|uniref:Rhamnogalacturonides degradation protein RhiN n=1 Tax=Salmonella enterica subsp. salamae TaxID=59202 RepID=A0A6D2G8P2_SALER|nr:Rhamnogalacturonides degradation protein RhiN [Salmonella enterica subsp. salamae]